MYLSQNLDFQTHFLKQRNLIFRFFLFQEVKFNLYGEFRANHNCPNFFLDLKWAKKNLLSCRTVTKLHIDWDFKIHRNKITVRKYAHSDRVFFIKFKQNLQRALCQRCYLVTNKYFLELKKKLQFEVFILLPCMVIPCMTYEYENPNNYFISAISCPFFFKKKK